MSAPGVGDENAAVRVAAPSRESSSRARGERRRRRAERRSRATTPATISSRAAVGRASGAASPSSASSASSAGGTTSSERSGAPRPARPRSPGRPPALERRVLPQDRPLEPLQLLARLEPELVRQLAPGHPVASQRLGLAAGAVEREHQLAAQALPQRMLGDERLELADELGVTAERQVGVDPLLERRQPQLLQPRDLGLGERLVGEVGERRPAPQRERLAQLRAAAVCGRARRASADSRSKRARSSSDGVDAQHVAGRARRQPARRPSSLRSRET